LSSRLKAPVSLPITPDDEQRAAHGKGK